MKNLDEISAYLKGGRELLSNYESKSFTPYQKIQSKTAQIKKAVFSFLAKRDYEKLDLLVEEFSFKELENFYQREAFNLLHFVIVGCQIPESLEYVLTKMQKDVISSTLKKNNFSLLEGFFGGYNLMEKSGVCDKSKRQIVYEKTIILSKVDDPEIKEFIKSKQSNYLIETDKLKKLGERKSTSSLTKE